MSIQYGTHSQIPPKAPPFPMSEDPCPQCMPGGTCRTPKCGRLIRAQQFKTPDINYELELNNLLARIHRDGGHYIAEHGLGQALRSADIKVAKLHATIDEIERIIYEK